jgi:cytochrome c oxidase subunit III
MREAAPAGHRVVDVSALPDQGAFGPAGLIWWGTVGFMVIEGSMFVMVLITYFYLRLRVEEWPPSLPNPSLFYGTLNLVILFASVWPNHRARIAGEECRATEARVWLVVCVLFGLVLLVVRGLEFTALNARWDDNAYGSITWALMVLHTMHLATDVADTGVLAALAYAHPITKHRFIDIAENGVYWYFIVAWWIPIYLTVYFAPRWL